MSALLRKIHTFFEDPAKYNSFLAFYPRITMFEYHIGRTSGPALHRKLPIGDGISLCKHTKELPGQKGSYCEKSQSWSWFQWCNLLPSKTPNFRVSGPPNAEQRECRQGSVYGSSRSICFAIKISTCCLRLDTDYELNQIRIWISEWCLR